VFDSACSCINIWTDTDTHIPIRVISSGSIFVSMYMLLFFLVVSPDFLFVDPGFWKH
jgi:hypothetical protein